MAGLQSALQQPTTRTNVRLPDHCPAAGPASFFYRVGPVLLIARGVAWLERTVPYRPRQFRSAHRPAPVRPAASPLISEAVEFHVTVWRVRQLKRQATRLLCNISNPDAHELLPPFAHIPLPTTMTGRGGGGGRRVLLPPINFLFKLLQQRTTVQIWLYEQLSIRIVGTIRVRTSFPCWTRPY